MSDYEQPYDAYGQQQYGPQRRRIVLVCRHVPPVRQRVLREGLGEEGDVGDGAAAEFLPPWVSRQDWYRGSGVPRLSLAAAFRLEDPAGEVGMETHLLSDGETICQVPMTYRGAPLPDAPAEALIVQAEHSELGTRWIYDAAADPVWRETFLRFVADGGAVSLRARDGFTNHAVTGRPLILARLQASDLTIELNRVLSAGDQSPEPVAGDAAGLVTVTSPQLTARLAVIR